MANFRIFVPVRAEFDALHSGMLNNLHSVSQKAAEEHNLSGLHFLVNGSLTAEFTAELRDVVQTSGFGEITKAKIHELDGIDTKTGALNYAFNELAEPDEVVVSTDAKLHRDRQSFSGLINAVTQDDEVKVASSRVLPYPTSLFPGFQELSPDEQFFYRFHELKKENGVSPQYVSRKFRAGMFGIESDAWEPIPEGVADDHFIGRNAIHTYGPQASVLAPEAISFMIPRYRLREYLGIRYGRNAASHNKLKEIRPDLYHLPGLSLASEVCGKAVMDAVCDVRTAFSDRVCSLADGHNVPERIDDFNPFDNGYSFASILELNRRGVSPTETAGLMTGTEHFVETAQEIVENGFTYSYQDNGRSLISVPDNWRDLLPNYSILDLESVIHA